MRFAHGDAVAPLKVVGDADGKKGTRVTFLPSPATFKITEFDFDKAFHVDASGDNDEPFPSKVAATTGRARRKEEDSGCTPPRAASERRVDRVVGRADTDGLYVPAELDMSEQDYTPWRSRRRLHGGSEAGNSGTGGGCVRSSSLESKSPKDSTRLRKSGS